MTTGTTDHAGVPIVAPNVRDLDELASQLTEWLAGKLDGATDLRLDHFEYPRGAGQSHETILFEAHWNESGESHDQGLVVRIKPTRFTVFVDDLFVEQFEVMRVVHASGAVPIAKVLWLEEDPQVLGAPFFVMERLRGRVAVSNPSYLEVGWISEATPAQRAHLWDQGVRALATLQTLPLEMFDFLQTGTGTTGFAAEWERWDRFLGHIERPDRPLVEYRHIWSLLRDRMPADPMPGLVWGDARIGNLLVDDDFDVIAMMDWEQPSLGGGLQDLGWWLFIERTLSIRNGGRSLPGIPDREQTAALWAEVTGADPVDLDWYETFAGLKIAALGINIMDMRGIVLPGGDYTATPMMHGLRQLLGEI